MNISRIKAIAVVLAIAVIAVSFSSCDQLQKIFQPGTPQMDGFSGEVPVGVVVSLTGPLAPLGMALRNSAELALEEINAAQRGAARIKFIGEDGQGTPEGGVEAFNKLIHQDGVSAILGPTTSSSTQEAFPIAQENGVVAFSATAAAAGLGEIGDFVFLSALTVDVLVPLGVEITKEKLGYQKVAMIVDSVDLFSQSSAEALTTAFNDSGVEILTTETLETGDTDFSAQLTRIKELNPDAVFISALPIEGTQVLIQGRQLGIPADIPFVVPQALAIDDVQRAGAAAEGVITFSTWVGFADTPGNQAFVQNYTAKYGSEPNKFVAQMYAAVYILAAAIAEAQSADSSAIRDAMANTRDLDTVLGSFSFDANGDAVYDPIILVVQNGRFEVFE